MTTESCSCAWSPQEPEPPVAELYPMTRDGGAWLVMQVAEVGFPAFGFGERAL